MQQFWQQATIYVLIEVFEERLITNALIDSDITPGCQVVDHPATCRRGGEFSCTLRKTCLYGNLPEIQIDLYKSMSALP
jgi:hypothetical protein